MIAVIVNTFFNYCMYDTSILREDTMSKTFGQKINEERQRLKLTLEELGEKVGSTKAYIWELENKKTARPSAEEWET